MKKSFTFIFFSLIFLCGGVAIAQEKICPVIDLKENIVSLFYIETKQENIIDILNNKQNITQLYYDVNLDNLSDVNKLYNLVKYYDDTIIYLSNIGCSGYTDIDFIVKNRNVAVLPYDNNSNKSNLIYNFTSFYNDLKLYNNTLNFNKEQFINYRNNTSVATTYIKRPLVDYNSFKMLIDYRKSILN